MLTIDGSMGEGGGQVLRTSLALSALTGQPFLIEKIRANRKKPGLMRQHLTAVQAAARISSAHVEGDAIGSPSLRFTPGPVVGGVYDFAIGTRRQRDARLADDPPAAPLGKGTEPHHDLRRDAQPAGAAV